jgi:hypothetical protein
MTVQGQPSNNTFYERICKMIVFMRFLDSVNTMRINYNKNNQSTKREHLERKVPKYG